LRGCLARLCLNGGNCGFVTAITAEANPASGKVRLHLESQCPHVCRLAAALPPLKPLQELSYRGGGPETLRLAREHLPHTACPVPIGILKALEVAAGLALPQKVTLEFCSEPEDKEE
jgi:hypothetical protein